MYADFHVLFVCFYMYFFTRAETFKRKEPIIIVQKKETEQRPETSWQKKWIGGEGYEKQSQITARKVIKPGFHH